MRDKKDNATFDLPGFEPAPHDDTAAVSAALPDSSAEPASASKRTRARRTLPKQEQLMLVDLADTDATGLPAWKHDPDLDLTGLPIWKPAA
ncbi:hypothetical protein [Massilia putida]|uniref:hypothetical protein n=1 Tax=Massilia putida TaxID=1141883 RepID=UPI000952E426|nr:hypothetical protein [Massilia putida]